jgi:hypothetical protein
MSEPDRKGPLRRKDKNHWRGTNKAGLASGKRTWRGLVAQR